MVSAESTIVLFENMVMVGRPPADLQYFADQLVAIFLGATDIPCRKREDQLSYRLYCERNSESMREQIILEQMNGAEVMILRNIFGYTALLKGNCVHECIWYPNKSLTIDQLIEVVQANNIYKPYFMFTHAAQNKTIPGINHTHLIREDKSK